MADVYRKKGLPDRLVDTEVERTAAVWDGFKKVEDAKPADAKSEGKPEATSNAAGTNTGAPKQN
jgi:hypothetical protein